MGERTIPARPVWLDLIIVALVVVPVFGVPYLVQFAAVAAIGDPATTDHERLSHQLLTAAFLVGTVLPLIGFLITFHTRQILMRFVFGVMAALVLVLSAVAWFNSLRGQGS